MMEACTICSNQPLGGFTQQDDCFAELVQKLLEHDRHAKQEFSSALEKTAKLETELEATSTKLRVKGVELDKVKFKMYSIRNESAKKDKSIKELKIELAAVDTDRFEKLKQENAELKAQVERLIKVPEPLPVPSSAKRRKANSFDGAETPNRVHDSPKNKSDSAIPDKKTSDFNTSSGEESTFFIDSPPPRNRVPFKFDPPDSPSLSPVMVVIDLPKRTKIEYSSAKKKLADEFPQWHSKSPVTAKPFPSTIAKKTPKPMSPLRISKSGVAYRQTKLNFERSQDKSKPSMNDETFCEELIFPKKPATSDRKPLVIRKKPLPRTQSSEDEFCFQPVVREKPRFELKNKENVVTPKKKSPKKIKKEPVPVVPFSDCSSLMIIPNGDTEIISLDTQDPEEYDFEALLEGIDNEFQPRKRREEAELIRERQYERSSTRTNKDKQQQSRWDCDDCRKYYEARYPDMGPTQLQEVKNKCSRHRRQVNLHDTPDGFWNPTFSPTQDS